MRKDDEIQQATKHTEKQNIILRLRLAMDTHRYEVIGSLSEELKKIINK